MTEPTLADIFRTIKPLTDDTFDRIETAYWWLTHHHAGQWSQSYSDMCRLGRVYSPGAATRPHNHEAYNALCALAGCAHEAMESFGR